MRILFVNHLPMGTASFYRQITFGRFLMEKGHEVKMLVRSKPFPGREKYERPAEIDGIGISYWHEPFEYLLPSNIFQAIREMKGMDVIYLNRANPFSAVYTFTANLFIRKPIVVDLEDWDAIGGYSTMADKKLIEKFAMTFFEEIVPRRCDCVVVVSKYLYHRVIKMGISDDRIFYIPNGADTDTFNPDVSGEEVRAKYGLSPPTIVTMGILHKHEAVLWRRTIEILSLLVKKISEDEALKSIRGINLLHIGWGEELENLRNLARSSGIENRIIFAGELPRDDVPKHIAAGDVALFLLDDRFGYYHASSPLTIAEFMAMGKPIVATELGEVYESLKGRGTLVKGLNSEDYVDPLVELLLKDDLKKKYGKGARTRALERHSLKMLSGKVEEACKKAISIRKGG